VALQGPVDLQDLEDLFGDLNVLEDMDLVNRRLDLHRENRSDHFLEDLEHRYLVEMEGLVDPVDLQDLEDLFDYLDVLDEMN